MEYRGIAWTGSGVDSDSAEWGAAIMIIPRQHSSQVKYWPIQPSFRGSFARRVNTAALNSKIWKEYRGDINALKNVMRAFVSSESVAV